MQEILLFRTVTNLRRIDEVASPEMKANQRPSATENDVDEAVRHSSPLPHLAPMAPPTNNNLRFTPELIN